MGRAYLGRSPGGRLVAIKLIRPELADNADFRRRFAREVTAAKTVGGMYTATVVDADPEAAAPWLVTAYIDGSSLADVVATHGPLPADSVLQLAAALAEGLCAIHAAGLVHRDLKPTNVLLAGDGAADHRFRHIPGDGCDRHDHDRLRGRVARVHVSGAGRGARGGGAERRLQPRRSAGFQRHRRGAVRRGQHARADLPRGAWSAGHLPAARAGAAAGRAVPQQGSAAAAHVRADSRRARRCAAECGLAALAGCWRDAGWRPAARDRRAFRCTRDFHADADRVCRPAPWRGA